MSLTLFELDRPAGVRNWHPFTYEEPGHGFNSQWWCGPAYPPFESIFLRVLQNNHIEVARVHLHNGVGIDQYADVPAALEIQFIEVHSDHRSRGLGRAVVDLLHNRYPDRRLVARSEGVDGFWSSLGWRRHLHNNPEEARFGRPLFIQPQA